MPIDLYSLQALLALGVFWLLVAPMLSRENNTHRALIGVIAVALAIRYLAWRVFDTILPFEGSLLEETWLWIVLGVELLAFYEAAVFFLIMSKVNDRHKEADALERRLDSHPDRLPSVDVFIPTVNEGLDVLEKSIIGAKHIDYPDFKVWVLDDGRRPWLRELCARHGVGYITRDDRAGAKAGNLNHALSRTSGELFAIFDADFVPFRGFLRRTVGFFIFNDDVGIVQTPQHFYNQDVVQSNLYLEGLWPDEQRLFFDAMASSRDGWDAAFCCGACSILRRKSVEAAGGIPTSSITEDLLSTLSLLTVGYRTVFLNERLAQGMSADSIKGYFVQRARWCRGGIQCLFLPEGPLRAESLSLLQRILFAPTGWIIQPLTRLFIVVVPLVFLWLGLAPLHYATAGDLIAYLVPMLVMYMLGIQWLAPRKYLPVVSTAVGLFGAFRLFPVAVSSLISPFGKPFLVTPKGSGAKHGADGLTLTTSLALLLGTLAGVAVNAVPEYRIVSNPELLPAAIVWAAINTVMLFLCVLLSIDAPRRRKEERFLVHEPALLAGREVMLEDMSLGGCRLRDTPGAEAARRGQILPLKISGVRSAAAVEVLGSNQSRLTCRFVGQTEELREQMIAKLFTGAYESAALGVRSVKGVLQQLFKRAFGEQRG